jgi:DNA (cytosine-5)-methyltransferase 1
MAFDRLGIDYECVGISEIDKYAIKSYMAIHGDTKNFGDITKIKGHNLPEIDVFTYSFPCTDLSKAGQQKGLTRDTRSGLVYEVLRILWELKELNNLPKVLIMENVVDLVQVKFIKQFNEIQAELETLGYTNYTETMNAKDYGVAQNRDRVFMVSILGDYYYEFPKPLKLEKRLKDYLEASVDEKFYIKDFSGLTKINDQYQQLEGEKWSRMHDIGRRVYGTNGESPTIHTMGGGNLEPKIVEPVCLNSIVDGKQPSLTDRIYDSEAVATEITTSNFFMPNYTVQEPSIVVKENNATQQELVVVEKEELVIGSGQKNAFVGSVNGCSPTLTSAMGMGGGQTPMITNKFRIRKLTPRECWRLMGIDGRYFDKASQVNSNAQLYKQAGNGIVVDVFAAIVKNLI